MHRFVQRNHPVAWIEDCAIAFVLISGKPVAAGGKTLHAVGQAADL
jgi:hypothetical protein